MINSNSIPGLQTQITTNYNDINILYANADILTSTSIPGLQSQITTNYTEINKLYSRVDVLDNTSVPGLQAQITNNYRNISQKYLLTSYQISDITGVTSQIDYGYHNVTKSSNGQCRYSAHITIYPPYLETAGVIGYLPAEVNPYQVVWDYVYNQYGSNWFRVSVGNSDRSIRISTLAGYSYTPTQITAEYHMDF